MARVKSLERDSLPAELCELWDKFSSPPHNFSNQTAVLSNSPEAFGHLYGLIDTWRTAGSLPVRLIEIAVVTTSALNACPYCVGHHGLVLMAHGLSGETVEGILEPAPPGLDEKERLVRDYARLVTERAWGIRDSVFEDLRRHFDDRQIVELTVRIGLCSLFNKLNQALQIDLELSVSTDVKVAKLTIGSQ